MQRGNAYIYRMSNVIFTEKAAARIAAIKSEAEPYFRLKVIGGGCSGFSYDMKLDNAIKDNDLVIETAGEKLLVDPVSLEYLDGSTLDYVEELVGSAFKVINPNAASSCGCGVSFAV